MIQSQCFASALRSEHPGSRRQGYYDAEYNPFGTLPVISVCDGNQAGGVDPYLDQWAPPGPGAQVPLDAALAVDRNRNGVRDEDEPLIRGGHEPWDDTGTDGVFDEQEPGYDAVLNPDPNGDDYDPQLNPNGTERNHRYDPGEPFRGRRPRQASRTPQQSAGGYDLGEGDGLFTQATGLQNFQAQDLPGSSTAGPPTCRADP